jgi:hypothetical protein
MPISTKKQEYRAQATANVYAGMDTDTYPGTTWMKTAWSMTNLYWLFRDEWGFASLCR